jgi:transcriptional regulator with XRE-family HTH domain
MSLKQIIKAQGRTQRWIAGELGISEDTFSRMILEKQPFPVDKVEPLADLLGVPVVDVLHAVAPPGATPPASVS